MKILLICDRENWAYDAIAKALIKFNTNGDLEFDIFYLKGNEKKLKGLNSQYDLFFFLGWQLILERKNFLFKLYYKKRFAYIDDKKILTGIHSHHSWDNKETQPNKDVNPPKELILALSKFRAVNAVSNKLTRLFKQKGLTNITYTANGIDSNLFNDKIQIPLKKDKLIVGFSGNKKHDWRKGISEFIEPLEKKFEWCELKLAMPQGDYIPLNEMPSFYNKIDLYVCASSSEGFSLSVLEASSCGRPVISTIVGGSEDLIEEGENGFLVNRNFDDIAEKVDFLFNNKQKLTEMGKKNRKKIVEEYDWSIRVLDWYDFIKKV
jgi:glycosyltransferase involved in cell wall biosynthesis